MRRSRSGVGIIKTQLSFESLETRQLMACDATVESNWDTYGNGSAHTGYVAGSIGTQLDETIAWSRELDGRNVVHNGLVYGFKGNRLYAIDLRTGVDLWTREFGVPSFFFAGGLTFDSGNLYFLGQQKDYRLLYSVSATTGETNWTHFIAAQSLTTFPPVVGNGTVYVKSGSYGGLYGIDQDDGSLKFFVNINDNGDWSSAFSDGRLFTWADRLFAERSPDTGAVLWSIQFDKGQAASLHTNTPVVVADGIAYVAIVGTIYYDRVVAIDLQTRTILKEIEAFVPAFGPAAAGGLVYVDGPAAVLQANARSNVILPSYQSPSGSFYSTRNSQPVVTDDAVIKSADYKTYVFNRATRELLFTLPVGGEISLANNTLLVSKDRVLHAFPLCGAKPVTISASLKLEETAGAVEAKVSIGTKLPGNLSVQLTSSNPALLQLPGSVIIPAGQTSITFPINVVNNLIRNNDSRVELTASAPGYLNSKISITVNDDESAIATNISEAGKELNLGIKRSGYFAGQLGTSLPAQPEWSAPAIGMKLSGSNDIIFGMGSSLDASSGKQLWKNDIVGSGVFAGDAYYVSSQTYSGQIIYSIDPESGAINWASEHLPAPDKSNISVTDRWVFVGAGGAIYRINRENGKVESPNVVDGYRTTIYQDYLLVSGDITITALNVNDFSTRWKLQRELSGDHKYGELTAQNGRVSVNTQPGLRVYDIRTGAELWRLEDAFLGQPAMDNHSLFVAQYGVVIQFDAATGRRLRTYECGEVLTANQPIVTDDAIIVSSESRTFVLDRSSGQIKQWYANSRAAYLTQDFLYLSDLNTIKAFPLTNRPALTLMATESMLEGETPATYAAQVSVAQAQASDVIVTLQSDLRGRIEFPDVVTIPAGQTSVEFSITVLDDSFDNIQSKGYLLATAKNFRSSVSVLAVADDDMPVDGSIPGDWSISGVEPSRSGFVPGTIGTLPFPDLRWRTQTLQNGTSAVTSNGHVFVQAFRLTNPSFYSPVLLAFDADSGKLKWERGIEGANLVSALTATDGYLYVAASFQKELRVLAIDQTTGDLKWTSKQGMLPDSYFLYANSRRPAELVVSDGIVLVPLVTMGLLALSQESGDRLYFSTFNSTKVWSPAVLNGRVFVSDSQTFREIDLKTGAEVWSNPISISGSPPYEYSVPALAEGMAVCIAEGALVALDINTRAVRWKIPGVFYNTPAIAGGKVFAAEADLIRTFDLQTGAALEVVRLPELRGGIEQLDQFNVTDDAIVALASGDVVVLSRRTTERLWTFQGDSRLMNLAEDSLYLLQPSGLLAISLNSASSYGNADVNRDGVVTPLDALFIINHLNSPTSNPNLRRDVNSDGSVTPIDALLVINWLNRVSGTSAEGESIDPSSIAQKEMELASFDDFFEASLDDELVVGRNRLSRRRMDVR